MSSGDIEGENPLYLPQAKVYDRSCALGPCILLSEDPMPLSAGIRIEISRQGVIKFAGQTVVCLIIWHTHAGGDNAATFHKEIWPRPMTQMLTAASPVPEAMERSNHFPNT
jgi:fumarylacetoacetate (FAA) hydrolase family protein